MNDGIAIELIHGGHDAVLELLFGCDADVAQHRAGELGEETFDEVEPRAMLGGEGEFETARRLIGEPRLCLLGDVRGMIVEDQLDRRMGRRTGKMGKLKAKGLDALLTKPPKRHADGEGLFFKTLGKGRAYWTYRFTLNGRESERSLGPYPEMSLDEARIRHLRWVRRRGRRQVDPVGERRKVRRPRPSVTPSGAPTFGECADQHIGLNEGGWKNSKHHAQWVATLKTYAAPIRSKPVNEITTADVLAVLTPIWNDKPETARTVQRPHRGGAGLGSGRWLDSRGPAEPGSVEELARPQIAAAEEDRLARSSRGDAL